MWYCTCPVTGSPLMFQALQGCVVSFKLSVIVPLQVDEQDHSCSLLNLVTPTFTLTVPQSLRGSERM